MRHSLCLKLTPTKVGGRNENGEEQSDDCVLPSTLIFIEGNSTEPCTSNRQLSVAGLAIHALGEFFSYIIPHLEKPDKRQFSDVHTLIFIMIIPKLPTNVAILDSFLWGVFSLYTNLNLTVGVALKVINRFN